MSEHSEQFHVLPVASLTEFFRDSLRCALERQQLHVEGHTEHYVVNVLTVFARSEAVYEHTSSGGLALKPLVVMMSDALEAPTVPERQRGLQRLGDVSLFIAGVFAQSFARKLIDIDYYISMGARAYSQLAEGAARSRRGAALARVFTELAGKFQPLVDALNEVSEGSRRSNRDILRLYELWLRTGSRRSYGLLRELGVLPAPTGLAAH